MSTTANRDLGQIHFHERHFHRAFPARRYRSVGSLEGNMALLFQNSKLYLPLFEKTTGSARPGCWPAPQCAHGAGLAQASVSASRRPFIVPSTLWRTTLNTCARSCRASTWMTGTISASRSSQFSISPFSLRACAARKNHNLLASCALLNVRNYLYVILGLVSRIFRTFLANSPSQVGRPA